MLVCATAAVPVALFTTMVSASAIEAVCERGGNAATFAQEVYICLVKKRLVLTPFEPHSRIGDKLLGNRLRHVLLCGAVLEGLSVKCGMRIPCCYCSSKLGVVSNCLR